jgi:hypothetical protein
MHNTHPGILGVQTCNRKVAMILNAHISCNVIIDQRQVDLMKYK